MLSFLTKEDQLFDYIICLENDSETKPEIIYTKDEDSVETIINRIKPFCFPFHEVETTNREETSFIFVLTDVDKTLNYAYVSYRNDDKSLKTIAYCLLSSKYHPDLYLEIIRSISQTSKNIALKAVNNLLSQRINQDSPFDNKLSKFINIGSANQSKMLQNVDHLSPRNEIKKMYQYLFENCRIHDILLTLIAIMIDYKIVIMSSSAKTMCDCAMGLLGLVYPLSWSGTFIPVLPKDVLDVVAPFDAPGSCIVGIHSSMCLYLISDESYQYFVLNADAKYSAFIGNSPLANSKTICDLVTKSAESIKQLLKKYSPCFPFQKVQNKIRTFMIKLLATAYGLDVDNIEPKQIYDSFMAFKKANDDSFEFYLSQSQFIQQFMTKSFDERDQNDYVYNEFFKLPLINKNKEQTKNEVNDVNQKNTEVVEQKQEKIQTRSTSVIANEPPNVLSPPETITKPTRVRIDCDEQMARRRNCPRCVSMIVESAPSEFGKQHERRRHRKHKTYDLAENPEEKKRHRRHHSKANELDLSSLACGKESYLRDTCPLIEPCVPANDSAQEK